MPYSLPSLTSLFSFYVWATKKLTVILGLAGCQLLSAQDTIRPMPATDSIPVPHKSRVYLAAAGTAAGYAFTLTALSNAWYKDYPQSTFHFFDDTNEWLQVDKLGHVFSAYTASKLGMEVWGWAGLRGRKRIMAAGLSGALYMTTIEVLDGFSKEWGFSLSDLASNMAGGVLFIAQEMSWKEQRVQVKFSFHRNHYGDPLLDQRANDLFGRSSLERVLKDYNAQTYWLSANLASFSKKSRLPAWLNMALGYGAMGMFGGTENLLKDKTGAILFDRRDIPRYRQWYLAPDIDLTRIKTKSKLLKATFFLLNSFKFPTPAIGISGKGVEWKWVMF